jgi:hypothetical protein
MFFIDNIFNGLSQEEVFDIHEDNEIQDHI